MMAMLLAYDTAGNVVATLDHVVARDTDGTAIGLVDFAAHEAAGGRMRDIWDVSDAIGSATWPEWLGARAHDFRVELDGRSIAALVHKVSGFRRERAGVASAIAARHVQTPIGSPVDLRDLVGGPTRPLVLDDTGRSVPRSRPDASTPSSLPLIRANLKKEG